MAAKYCDNFIAAYEAHHPTSHEAIPVAGIGLGQFFPTEAILSLNSEEIRTQAMELASAAGFHATTFDMGLQRKTSLGAMCVMMTRQNQK